MKSKVHYIRVSTQEQNTSRQKEVIFGATVFEEKESGLIEFSKRTKGAQILAMASANELEELHVHSIDRLGRNTLDILNTIQFLTSKGVNVISKKEGLQTMVDGKENPIAKLMVGILATLSEFEINRMKERQRDGIAKAKERGVYKTNGGNKQRESAEQFLNKKSSKKVLKYLAQGNSLRATAKLAEVALGTVQKVVAVKDAYDATRQIVEVK
jgi:DNA invertase Pin-like site-specific DNA recombinase